jgi:hypothetical protein
MRQHLAIIKRITAFIFAFIIVFNSVPAADVYASDLPGDEYGDDIPATLYSNAFTNKGYTFIGWSLVVEREGCTFGGWYTDNGIFKKIQW